MEAQDEPSAYSNITHHPGALTGLRVIELADEHDRALATVVLPEEQGALRIFPVFVEGTDAARGAAARRFDFDHLGAQTRQH